MIKIRSRNSYGHLTNATKILGHISQAEQSSPNSWAEVSVFFWNKLLKTTERNPAIGLKILAVDGLYVFFKSRPIVFVHLRKRHFLLMANSNYRIFLKGDLLFGKEKRHDGAFKRSWTLNKKAEVKALLLFLRSFPVVKHASLKKSRTIPEWVKKFVKERDFGCCKVCRSKEDLHYDHVYPFSWGGGNDPKNVQLLCSRHNLEKSASLKY